MTERHQLTRITIRQTRARTDWQGWYCPVCKRAFTERAVREGWSGCPGAKPYEGNNG